MRAIRQDDTRAAALKGQGKVIRQNRPGAKLLKCWIFASVVYVCVAGALSLAPVRAVLGEARHQPAPTQARVVTGPLPNRPQSPREKVLRVIAKQTAISLAPPLLVLWFGWDLWFAIVGFLPPPKRTEDTARSPPN